MTNVLDQLVTTFEAAAGATGEFEVVSTGMLSDFRKLPAVGVRTRNDHLHPLNPSTGTYEGRPGLECFLVVRSGRNADDSFSAAKRLVGLLAAEVAVRDRKAYFTGFRAWEGLPVQAEVVAVVFHLTRMPDTAQLFTN